MPKHHGPLAAPAVGWLGMTIVPTLVALLLLAATASADAPCSCDTATSVRAFRACVRRAIRAVPKAERGAPLATLKRLAARATCGRAQAPKRKVACCLPFTGGQSVVRDRMCAALRAERCGGLGGAALAGATACAPNPCGWTADDIPVAHTPPGGYGDDVPAPVLAGCSEPLVEGAPDLRGLWRTVEAEVDGVPVPADHPLRSHVQRVEQCGDRLVVTAGGVVHDMRCDGTVENGVHDVAERDFTTPITVVATYEDETHVLRPVGVPIEVTRRRDGEHMLWQYLVFSVRLERIGGPEAAFPAP